MIFSTFNVAAEYQRRILLYGVLGAIVLRAVIILAGAWLVQEFHWVLYLFGGFLFITGFRLFVGTEKEPDLEGNVLILFACRHLRIKKNIKETNLFLLKAV